MAGFAALVGKPSVGKSTLMNKLIGEKIAIMSSRPQTTRNKITCVLTTEQGQIIFVDTPGLHKPHHKLGEYMVKVVEDALQKVDLVLMVADASMPRSEEEDQLLAKLKQISLPVILILNKVDKVHDKNKLLEITDFYAHAGNFKAIVPISALGDHDFNELLDEIYKYLPESPNLYPADMLTDQSERVLASELIREKLFQATRQEIPHALAVEVETFKERDNGVIYIKANIFVERDSQKGIVIGAKGSLLKKVGQEARQDIEDLVGSRVYLELKVKVRPDWRNKPKDLKEFGYTIKK